jgi:signal transduction histidine kinase
MSSGRVDRALRSTGFRLTAWYMAVFVLSLAAVAGVAEYFIARAVETKEQTLVSARLEEYRAEFEERGLSGLSHAVTERSSINEREIVVLTEAGRPVYESKPNAAQSATRSDWRVAVTSLSGDLQLSVGRNKASERELLERVRDGSLIALAAALLLGIAGGAVLTRRSLRPIEELTSVTDGILRSGKLDARVPTRGTGDDLDELAGLFNGMLARNEALVRGMREALDNVAHDLRTPLTRLRAGAELALKNPDDPAALREALADSMEESERVLSMLRTLMDISAAEAGAMRLEREDVKLEAIARQVLDTYQLVADERGVRVVSSLEPVSVVGDASRLRQLVANLVDNAIKYTEPGGLVEIRTRTSGDHAEIEVKDTGIGIPERDLAHVFERLYRGDRSRSQPGLGLGLSFVKAICEAHGGTVTVESSPNEGATFTVRLHVLVPR